jgi:hypothetical protein
MCDVINIHVIPYDHSDRLVRRYDVLMARYMGEMPHELNDREMDELRVLENKMNNANVVPFRSN